MEVTLSNLLFIFMTFLVFRTILLFIQDAYDKRQSKKENDKMKKEHKEHWLEIEKRLPPDFRVMSPESLKCNCGVNDWCMCKYSASNPSNIKIETKDHT